MGVFLRSGFQSTRWVRGGLGWGEDVLGSKHTWFLNYKNEFWKTLFLYSGRLLNIWIKDVGKFSFLLLSALFLLAMNLNLPAKQGDLLFSNTHALASRSLLTLSTQPGLLHALCTSALTCHSSTCLNATDHMSHPPQSSPASLLPSQDSSLWSPKASRSHLWGGYCVDFTEGPGRSKWNSSWNAPMMGSGKEVEACPLNLVIPNFLVKIHVHALLSLLDSKLLDRQDQFLSSSNLSPLPCT